MDSIDKEYNHINMYIIKTDTLIMDSVEPLNYQYI